MDLRPLERFRQKLTQISGENNIADTVTKAIAEAGKDRVSEVYATETKEVTTITDGYRLSVSGEALLYKEYGTGRDGKGTYPGNLPTRPFDFFSRGEWQHTNGWEYMYHPLTKQLGYWWFNGEKCYGQPAQAGMWNAFGYMRDNAADIARKALRSVNK